MSYRHIEHCPYCDTEYTVEFELEDDESMYCPSCGEQVPEFKEDDYEIDDEGEWEVE
jgi:uncharacterized paraquat-inducible protein A